MNRLTFRLIIGAVLAVVAFGAAYMRRGNTGEEYRKIAHKIVAQVDGYAAKPDYYDWLADYAHDKCFNEAYHMDVGSRYRRAQSWMDDEKYLTDLLHTMADEARTDNAVQVAEAIEKFRVAHQEPEQPSRPARRR